MALIKCPDCGKEVSDRAAACIHCGCPLQSQQVVQPTKVSRSKRVVLEGSYKRSLSLEGGLINILPSVVNSVGKLLYLDGDKVLLDGVSSSYASALKRKLMLIGLQIRIEDSESEVRFDDPENRSGKICCPKCGCLEYNAGARGFSVVTGFIGSGKTVLTCLHCGNRWKPGK